MFHVDYTALSLQKESDGTTPSGPAPRSRHSVPLSLNFPVGVARDVRTQTVSLCSVPSTHHATAADASTQLPISEFLQLCLTKHFFRSTVPLRLHEDFREAQTSSNTGNAMAVTFADAATQLSLAEFFERCILSRASRRVPNPAPAHPTSGCINSGFPTQSRFRRCNHTTPAHRVLSPKHMDATLSNQQYQWW